MRDGLLCGYSRLSLFYSLSGRLIADLGCLEVVGKLKVWCTSRQMAFEGSHTYYAVVCLKAMAILHLTAFQSFLKDVTITLFV